MLTRLRVRNFKQFGEAEVDLGKSVVLIGPNNSGKTTALQALSLWDVGLRLWTAKRGGKASPEKRPGVTINRRDLISIPVPSANLLWRELHVRNVEQVGGKPRTNNIRIDIEVEGVTDDEPWVCGFEFDYSNEESFVCRPQRLPGFEKVAVHQASFSKIPEHVGSVRVAYLPPMSGLADREFVKQPGEIGFLIGQGQTAQVLRNLCYQLYSRDETGSDWAELTRKVQALFGVTLLPPRLIAERAEIEMEYEERNSVLDLSSSGRGLQQTVLLLAHLYANKQTVLLLDEPDAHLEILRQRQTYQLLTETAQKCDSQIISASHSEVVLQEAAGSGKVVAFVGKPHLINDRGSQVIKALSTIGWDQYYQAEQTGWVLYLEDSTDLAILRAFARLLGHPCQEVLEKPFCHYVSTNVPRKAEEHFYGLREGKSDLVGLAIFDRIDKVLAPDQPLRQFMWSRREIENYFLSEEVLMRFASEDNEADLFSIAMVPRRIQAMQESIAEVSAALRVLNKPTIWSTDVKASDDVLDPLFRLYFEKLKLPLTFRKADYHILANYVRPSDIDLEISEKLDLVAEVASSARPRRA